MKPFVLLLGSSLLLATTAHAQLGLRVGGNLSKLRTNPGINLTSSSGSQLGYQVGVTYQLPLTTWLSLVPELQYSNERVTLTQASYGLIDVSFGADSRKSSHYLNVPVMARVTLGPAYVEAGPQASLLLGGRQIGTSTINSWGSHTTSTFDRPVTEFNQRFDVGPSVGLGVQLPAGLGLNVRAYWGLTTLNKERSDVDGEHQRRSLQASLTYRLPTR